MSPDGNLEILMTAYQGGDFGAATALILQLSPQLHRFFVGQLASRKDADDLLQETWLLIHKVRHTYRAGEPVMPWFYGIARHVRVNHYRRTSRVSLHEEQVEAPSELPAPSPETTGSTAEMAEILAPLPESQREVILMLKVEGMSLEEVARATSSTVGSVKQKAHRGYERLRERLAAMRLSQGRRGGLS
jgi:RNA polymerase sigma-70 factor (ECF subfamily)